MSNQKWGQNKAKENRVGVPTAVAQGPIVQFRIRVGKYNLHGTELHGAIAEKEEGAGPEAGSGVCHTVAVARSPKKSGGDPSDPGVHFPPIRNLENCELNPKTTT